MKKILAFVMAMLLLIAMAGCRGEKQEENRVLRLGTTPGVNTEIARQSIQLMAAKGWTVEILEYESSEAANADLKEGKLDVAFTQHISDLNAYNAGNGTNFVAAGKVHYIPMCMFPGTTGNVEALEQGASIAIPNDPANRTRALLLLEEAGLIRLADEIGATVTQGDIWENDLQLQLVEVAPQELTGKLLEADMAVIPVDLALNAGLWVMDAAALENTGESGGAEYVQVLAVKKENRDSEKIQALVSVLNGDVTRGFIEETYAGDIVPMF